MCGERDRVNRIRVDDEIHGQGESNRQEKRVRQ